MVVVTSNASLRSRTEGVQSSISPQQVLSTAATGGQWRGMASTEIAGQRALPDLEPRSAMGLAEFLFKS